MPSIFVLDEHPDLSGSAVRMRRITDPTDVLYQVPPSSPRGHDPAKNRAATAGLPGATRKKSPHASSQSMPRRTAGSPPVHRAAPTRSGTNEQKQVLALSEFALQGSAAPRLMRSPEARQPRTHPWKASKRWSSRLPNTSHTLASTAGWNQDLVPMRSNPRDAGKDLLASVLNADTVATNDSTGDPGSTPAPSMPLKALSQFGSQHFYSTFNLGASPRSTTCSVTPLALHRPASAPVLRSHRQGPAREPVFVEDHRWTAMRVNQRSGARALQVRLAHRWAKEADSWQKAGNAGGCWWP